ncbi:hypothetical protein GALL_534280 [mine drainage metagenome]|uniref:Uncharacterized protein n=1 Tax=mine drainage metagenome TaxID=410659 RepID=A0A1J5P0E4_9ZZZZ
MPGDRLKRAVDDRGVRWQQVLQHGRRQVLLVRQRQEAAHVLRQARPAERESRPQIGRGDVQHPVLAQQPQRLPRIDPVRRQDGTNLVGEGQLHRVEDVGNVLDALGHADRGDMHGRVDRGIDLPQDRRVVARRGADQGKRRGAEIAHRGPFAQEFRVAVVEHALAQPPSAGILQQRDNPVLRRTRRHGGAHDDGVRPRLASDRRADLPDDAVHVTQRHAAIGGAGRADGNERDLGAMHRRRDIVGRGQPALLDGPCDQRVDGFLDDRRPAGPQHCDLGRRHIDADDLMPQFREATAGDDADIADTEDRNTHALAILAVW